VKPSFIWFLGCPPGNIQDVLNPARNKNSTSTALAKGISSPEKIINGLLWTEFTIYQLKASFTSVLRYWICLFYVKQWKAFPVLGFENTAFYLVVGFCAKMLRIS
jgi:hypothetical protein